MIVNFSCPNCGADMSYDIKLGKLHCDHCDHSEDIQPDGESYKNAAGEVIGINSAKIATETVEGIGYAIPISDVSDQIGRAHV